ncbi:MAG: Gfo/Idh/MocA family oxidoreductase, partial [Lachnospiraceae bacterium]|nr:Gfo/Idh/MocA family oxidoreductase [Lachnospiraceae bacterium]
MRYALIGCGRISPNHIIAARKNDLEIVAVSDIVRQNAEDKILQCDLDPQAVKVYEDYKEMLEKEKPELVAIATESGKHASIALDCIAAGCHVIIEKPIALSIADAD